MSFLLICGFNCFAVDNNASKPWTTVSISEKISNNVLYLPIAHDSVKFIPIVDNRDELVDLIVVNNPRLRAYPYTQILPLRKL